MSFSRIERIEHFQNVSMATHLGDIRVAMAIVIGDDDVVISVVVARQLDDRDRFEAVQSTYQVTGCRLVHPGSDGLSRLQQLIAGVFSFI